VSEPPVRQEEAPSIQLGGYVPLFEHHGLKGFDADVRLTVNGCRNPVDVSVDVLLTGPKNDAEVAYYTPSSPAAFSGFIGDPTQTARAFSVTMFTNRGPQHMSGQPFGSNAMRHSWSERRSATRSVANSPSSFRSFSLLPEFTLVASPTRRKVGQVQVGGVPVAEIQFQANWVSHRSRGTCYVYIPEVYSNDLGRPDAFVPGSGSVELVGLHGGTVDSIHSLPPPTDSRGPSWTCPLRGFSPK
jgi:hypothetical protein